MEGASPAQEASNRHLGMSRNHTQEKSLRQEAVMEKVVNVLTAGVTVTEEELWENYRKENDTARIEYAILELDNIEWDQTPEPDELADYFENNTIQLFNLADDPGENNDLSREEPLKAMELKSMLENWRTEVKAKMMSPNPDFRMDARYEYFN